MADPRSQIVTFPLNLGMNNVAFDEQIQPAGADAALAMSLNTRLTKVPGVVSKSPGVTQLSTTGTGYGSSPRGGLIPHGLLDSTANPCNDQDFSKRISGSGLATIKSIAFTSNQSSYYPAQVSSAGQLPGTSQVYFNPSVAYVASTGLTYYVYLRCVGGLTAVTLVVLADDGREVIQATDLLTLAQAYSDNRNFAAVTAHGTTVLLWYAVGGAVNISVCTLTVDTTALTATIGTPSVIYTQTLTGVLGPQKTQLAYDENDTANVYLVAPHDANANWLHIMKITVSTRTVAATADVILAGAYTHVAIAYLASTSVILAASVTGVGINEVELTPALGAGWNITGKLHQGQVACGFQTRSGTVYRVFAASRIEATYDSTYVEFRDNAGALLAGASGTVPHQTMVGHIATQRDAQGILHALIPTQACYRPENAADSYSPTDVDFVSDPSIELVRMDLTWNAYTSAYMLAPSTVARLGTDIAVRYPGSLVEFDYTGAAANVMFAASPRSCIAVGAKILVTYLGENIEEGVAGAGYAVRYAWLSFDSVQPRYALAFDGTAYVAGALPATWDGNEIAEFGPMRVPVMTGTAAGGSAAALTGPATYLFVAVVSWKDAQGRIHRSAPSNTVTITAAAPQPTLTIKLPLTYRNLASQYGLQVTIYASEPNGLVCYAQPYFAQAITTLAPGALTLTLTNIPQPVVDAFHPAIYTDGSATQELATFCPNACLDVAIVSERLWMLDAEQPSRWWFSKPRVSGYAFEMSPDLHVDLPANAGSGVATSELNGAPLFMTSKGIWTVSGEGPDALAQPPEFSSPAQLSDVACTQRNSVVRTPVGVMFVSNNRFVTFAGQASEHGGIDATLYGNIVGTAVFRKQQEACFFTAQGYVYVFNWQRQAWTLWGTDTTGTSTIAGVAQRADGKVLFCSTAGLWLMDPETTSTTAQIYLETGWVMFGGPQDNNTVQNLVLHAKRAGSHALTLAINVDYRQDSPASKAYTAAAILACVDDATTTKRYDLYPELVTMPCRAFKVSLTESSAAGEAFMPINLSLQLTKVPGLLLQSVHDEARI